MENYINKDENNGVENIINNIERNKNTYETKNITTQNENIENNTTYNENYETSENNNYYSSTNNETREENNYYYSTKNEGNSSEVSNFSTQNDGDSYTQNSANAFSTNIFENSAEIPRKAENESRTVNINIDMSGATYYVSSEVDIDDIADLIGRKILEILHI